MKTQITGKLNEYFWTRYIPDSTYKTYAFIDFLNQMEEEQDYKRDLMEVNLGGDESISKVVDEKKRILNKLGFEYPENREEDIKLLEAFKLIEKDDSENTGYRLVEDIKRPEEVIELDEEEVEALNMIKFEINNASAINGLLSLVLTNGGKLDCPVDHITNMTKVKISDIRTVINFLVNEEGSLIYSGSKKVDKLKKQDRVILEINEPVFSEKRLVMEEQK